MVKETDGMSLEWDSEQSDWDLSFFFKLNVKSCFKLARDFIAAA